MKVRKKRLLGKSGGGKQTRKITDRSAHGTRSVYLFINYVPRLLFLVVAQHALGALPVADLFFWSLCDDSSTRRVRPDSSY